MNISEFPSRIDENPIHPVPPPIIPDSRLDDSWHPGRTNMNTIKIIGKSKDLVFIYGLLFHIGTGTQKEHVCSS